MNIIAPIITFVQHRAGSRIPRLAKAMERRGWRVRMLTREPLWPDSWQPEKVTRWGTAGDLIHRVLEDEETYVYHVSQDYDCEWMAGQVLLARNHQERWHQRVVWDLRDIGSMHHRQIVRNGRFSPPQNLATIHEAWAANRVDGLVHVSGACAKWLRDFHPMAAHIPTAMVHNMVTEEQLAPWPPWPDPDTRAGLVYSGGIGTVGSNSHRDYGEHMKAFVAADRWGLHPVCVQGSVDPGGQESYEALGVEVCPRVPQAELVQSLTRWRWGLVSFSLSYALGEAAMPNKLWEYLAAGVVPVCCYAHQARTWCEEQGVGIGGATLEECLGKMTRETWERCHAQIRKMHRRWTMEAQAEAYELLLRNILVRPPQWAEVWSPVAGVWDPLYEDAMEAGNVVLVDEEEAVRREFESRLEMPLGTGARILDECEEFIAGAEAVEVS